jgi:hypothetical protein
MSLKYPNFRMMYSSTEAPKGKAYVLSPWVDSVGASVKFLNTGVGATIKAAAQPKHMAGNNAKHPYCASRAFHKF